MAVAMVERGPSKLACENKRELVQARTVTASRASDGKGGIFWAAAPPPPAMNQEAMATLRPLVEDPPAHDQPVQRALRLYWLARAVALSDTDEAVSLMEQAATLKGPWAHRAAASISAKGPGQ
jgi:hypothetical protein